MADVISQASSPPQKPKVIYVMGAGRSGSTILGVLLGNCADVLFAGELYKWLPRAGAPKLTDARRVEFWGSVRARLTMPQGLAPGEVHRYLERSSALARLGRIVRRRRLRDPYRRFAGELIGAIAATAGTDYVVDTSHYPLRARELQALDSVELHLVLLVRDPQDVVVSFARDDVAERRFDPLTTRAYLLLTYALSAWVFLRQPRERRATVFYEDLLDDPAGVLRALLDGVGSHAPLPDFGSLATGVALHGNRLLASDVVSLQPRRRSNGRGSFGARVFARLLSSALARLRPRLGVSSTAASALSAPEVVG
jgi:hypothetical protein